MKLFKILLLTLTLGLCFQEAEAQPQNIGKASSYEALDADSVIQRYDYRFFGDANTFTIGVHYTKGASEDTLSTVQVYHALSEAALDAGLGAQLAVDSVLQFDHPDEAEYKEHTFVVTGRVGFIDIKLNEAGTATDTFNIQPKIFVKKP